MHGLAVYVRLSMIYSENRYPLSGSCVSARNLWATLKFGKIVIAGSSQRAFGAPRNGGADKQKPGQNPGFSLHTKEGRMQSRKSAIRRLC
jgi:hypothetical protein